MFPEILGRWPVRCEYQLAETRQPVKVSTVSLVMWPIVLCHEHAPHCANRR